MSAFEFAGPDPMYVQLARELQRRIDAGTYPVGQRIPSEAEIRQEFGVGRATTRAAVEILRENGAVVTAKGRGTFVVEQRDTSE